MMMQDEIIYIISDGDIFFDFHDVVAFIQTNKDLCNKKGHSYAYLSTKTKRNHLY